MRFSDPARQRAGECGHGDRCVVHVRLALGARADEGLPNEQAASLGDETRPVDVEGLMRTSVADRSEYPRRLHEAGGERTGAGTGRPRSVAFASPRSAELQIALGLGHELRALEPQRDGTAAHQLIGHRPREMLGA
jgi:hypothetical protein